MNKFEVVSESHRKHPSSEIRLPRRGSSKAAAYDFYSPVDEVVEPGKSLMVWTDIKAIFGDNEVLLLNVRSSMGKQPVMLANTQGWIDSDYYGNVDNDGNIGVKLYNLGSTDYVIKEGDRICQGMLVRFGLMEGGEDGEERTGGFGSTNI